MDLARIKFSDFAIIFTSIVVFVEQISALYCFVLNFIYFCSAFIYCTYCFNVYSYYIIIVKKKKKYLFN